MAKQAYIERKVRTDTLLVIQEAERICNEYAAKGYTLTLRQLFYQFIARDLFPESWIDPVYNRKNGLAPDTKNTEKSYDRLGEIVNMARLAGLLDWDHLEDKTRNRKRVQVWDSPKDVIDAARYSFRLDPWLDQPNFVFVLVEKEALESVVARACNTYRIPYMACKGYMSQSEMRAQALMLARRAQDGKIVHIWYFGDHDPSGIDMSEDVQGRMDMFMGGVQFNRLALNMDQILVLNPPSNPAKLSDSRYKKYVQQFGVEDSWELDALTPEAINTLIEDAATDLIDWDAWETTISQEKHQQSALDAVASHWTDVVSFMDGMGYIKPAAED